MVDLPVIDRDTEIGTLNVPDLVERVLIYTQANLQHTEDKTSFSVYDPHTLLVYKRTKNQGCISVEVTTDREKVTAISRPFKWDEIPSDLECVCINYIPTKEQGPVYSLHKKPTGRQLATNNPAFEHLTEVLNTAVDKYDLRTLFAQWKKKYCFKEDSEEQNNHVVTKKTHGLLGCLLSPLEYIEITLAAFFNPLDKFFDR